MLTTYGRFFDHDTNKVVFQFQNKLLPLPPNIHQANRRTLQIPYSFKEKQTITVASMKTNTVFSHWLSALVRRNAYSVGPAFWPADRSAFFKDIIPLKSQFAKAFLRSDAPTVCTIIAYGLTAKEAKIQFISVQNHSLLYRFVESVASYPSRHLQVFGATQCPWTQSVPQNGLHFMPLLVHCHPLLQPQPFVSKIAKHEPQIESRMGSSTSDSQSYVYIDLFTEVTLQ